MVVLHIVDNIRWYGLFCKVHFPILLPGSDIRPLSNCTIDFDKNTEAQGHDDERHSADAVGMLAGKGTGRSYHVPGIVIPRP